MKPKYPNAKAKLTGEDGNSYAILGAVRRAMKKAGVSVEEIEEFTEEATSGDRDHLLQTCIKWVTVS
jgi:hypothetical protein